MLSGNNLCRALGWRLLGGWLVMLLGASLLPAAESLPDAVTIAGRAEKAVVGVYCAVDGDKFYGTGTIVSPAGYVLTSTTAVPPGATGITVYLPGSRRLPASLLATNQEVETTLLRLKSPEAGATFPFIPLAPRLPPVGEAAYTLGNANNMLKFGSHASFSAGTISGFYQVKSVDTQSGYHGNALETTAAVNQGQDGGPLLDAHGHLVGIVSRSFSTRRWQGLAVPIINILQAMDLGEQARLVPPPAKAAPAAPPAVVKAAEFMVSLQVKRRYAPERLTRPNWRAYRANQANWAKLPAKKQRQIIADFFATDHLLAANQMLRRPEGAVTGWLISESGHILTSAFNVQQSDTVYLPDNENEPQLPGYRRDWAARPPRAENLRQTVNRVRAVSAVLPGGKTLPAAIIGFHLPLGLALLKVDTDAPLAYYDLAAQAASAPVGARVFLPGVSVGGQTLNCGILSALKRGGGGFVQFDAMLNYGNSGSLLLDARGRFIGLTVAPLKPAPVLGRILPFKAPPGETALAVADYKNVPNSGVGLAAAASGVLAAIKRLRQSEGVIEESGVYLGFSPTAASQLAAQITIGQVQAQSPAARAGLERGDLLEEVDGLATRSWAALQRYLREKKPGDEITLKVFRPLGKPYILLGETKIQNGGEFEDFLRTAADGARLPARIMRPGITQQFTLRLAEKP